MRLVLGDFAPDLDPVIAGLLGERIPPAVQAILTDSQWCYSTRGGFRNMPSPLPVMTALPFKVTGAFATPLGGEFVLVLATANQLYQTPGGNLVNQNLNLRNLTNPWYFTVYGNDLLATNGVDPIQVSSSGENFQALPGMPPISSIVEATDFTLFAILADSNEFVYTFNDTIWTPSLATITVTGALTSTPGIITAAKALRAGITLYKANALYSGQWSGSPPFFWNFGKVSDKIGTPGPNSVISVIGPTIFGGGPIQIFVGPSDFYTFDGYSLSTIPNNLSRWFFGSYQGNGDLDQNYSSSIFLQWDLPRNQVIFWYPSVNASPAGTLDSYLSLSLATGKWLHGRNTIDTPLVGQVPKSWAYTWAEFENYWVKYVNIPGSPDPRGVYGAPFFGGSSIGLSGYVDTSHVLQALNGSDISNIPAFIITGDIGDKVSLYSLSRARPGFNQYPQGQPLASPAKLTVLSTYVAGQAPIAKQGNVDISDSGYFDFVSTDRLQRLKMMWMADGELADIDAEVGYAGEN
jgi:hypothetical protein